MKLAFSVAAHMEPDVLLVDEALAIGDIRFQRKCLARMHELAKHASAVVLVSHNHESIAQLCDRAAWLDHGRLLQIGSAEDVVAGYLASLRTESPATQWKGNAGDDTLRLLAAYVRYAQEGRPDTADDLIIGFRPRCCNRLQIWWRPSKSAPTVACSSPTRPATMQCHHPPPQLPPEFHRECEFRRIRSARGVYGVRVLTSASTTNAGS